MKTSTKTLSLCIIAFSAVLNLLGGTVALAFRLPVYLDSFGTIFTAAVLGPAAGIIPGLISGIISGCTSDVYAFFYIPVQMILGLVCGLMLRRIRPFERNTLWKLFPLAAVVSIPATLVSAAITAEVFGGITSSGSSVLVQLFHTGGLPLTASVFLVQFLTDYLDRIIILAAVLAALPLFHRMFPQMPLTARLQGERNHQKKDDWK